jgi:hypothetical protein
VHGKSIFHKHPAKMIELSSKLSRQIRDIPDFLTFWNDLFEAQQRFILVSHEHPENLHRSIPTTAHEDIQSLLLSDFETWQRREIPRCAFYKSRVRPAFLTFMQSMPLIQQLYHKCPKLAPLEMRMLCSQIEIQTDIFFSGRHDLPLLPLLDQQTWLKSYLIVEDIREAIINNFHKFTANSNNPCNEGSSKLSWSSYVSQQSAQKHAHYPSGCLNPARELALSPSKTNPTVTSNIKVKRDNYPAEMISVGELASTQTALNSEIVTTVEPKSSSNNQIKTSRNINETSSQPISTFSTKIETSNPTILQEYHPAEISSEKELAMIHPAPSQRISTPENSRNNDNKICSIRKSSIVYLIPRRNYRVRKCKKLQFSMLRHKKCKQSGKLNGSRLNRRREPLSSLDLASNSTELSHWQPAKSIEMDEINQLFYKLKLCDDPEELKENVERTEFVQISTYIGNKNFKRRNQRKAQKCFEPSNSPIIVKRIVAHKQLICQTIRGRQKGRKKKFFSQFSSSFNKSYLIMIRISSFYRAYHHPSISYRHQSSDQPEFN